VIESIRNHDPDLAQKIMDKMFVFDDVIKLDDKAIQMVLKEVASDTLIVALKGAQPELKEKILANMSSRAAETLREDLESRGPMRCRRWRRSRRKSSRRAASGRRRHRL
jgi:flagellar motor switch protein FliG